MTAPGDISIQAWHQPNGPGNGWARCGDVYAETFFIFENSVRLPREFKTREEAKRYVFAKLTGP